MLNRFSLVALIGIVALAVGCGPRAEKTETSLILISIDTLRPDHLGCYGYPRPTSPTLDQLASRGVVFMDASSPAPWTLPAHASMLTGVYPNQHGLINHTRLLRAELPTLAESLRGDGFTTAAIVNSQYLSDRYGLERGFDDFEYVEEFVGMRMASDVGEKAIRWLSRNGDRRFFLFLHFYDVHSDYRSLRPYVKSLVKASDSQADGTTGQLLRMRDREEPLSKGDLDHIVDLYDAGIRQMDETLARLQAALEEEGLVKSTVILVTSDHGEEFMEHGGLLHGRTQYEELVRVPLILLGPGIPQGKKVRNPVSLVDIVPTLLGLVGIDASPEVTGMNLASLWSEDPPDISSRYLYAGNDHSNAKDNIRSSVRQGSFKLHHDRLEQRWALHELTTDPRERRDVSSEHPEVTQRLRAELEAFAKKNWESKTIAPLSAEDEAKLRSLGYLQ